MNKIKILVCGGRDFNNKDDLYKCLDNCMNRFGRTGMIIIHGAAKGADSLAGQWANENNVEEWKFPITKEDWKKHGKAAGPIRNEQMFNESEPDYVFVFPGGNGTKHMKSYAKASNKCIVVEIMCEKMLPENTLDV